MKSRKHLTLGILILAMFFGPPKLHAAEKGGDSTGGGNARVCFQNESQANKAFENGNEITDDLISSIESIEVLDLYLAKLPKGESGLLPRLDSIGGEERVSDYLSRIINRVVVVLPEFSMIQVSRDHFKNENTIHYQSSLKRLHDESGVVRTENNKCVLATMAIQENRNGTHYLHIDDRLYMHPNHSNWSKAVLLLHEYVYQWARDLGQTDSRNTQLFVESIIGNLRGIPVCDILKTAKRLGFLPDRDTLNDFDNCILRTSVFRNYLDTIKKVTVTLAEDHYLPYPWNRDEFFTLRNKYPELVAHWTDINMILHGGVAIARSPLEALAELDAKTPDEIDWINNEQRAKLKQLRAELREFYFSAMEVVKQKIEKSTAIEIEKNELKGLAFLSAEETVALKHGTYEFEKAIFEMAKKVQTLSTKYDERHRIIEEAKKENFNPYGLITNLEQVSEMNYLCYTDSKLLSNAVKSWIAYEGARFFQIYVYPTINESNLKFH